MKKITKQIMAMKVKRKAEKKLRKLYEILSWCNLEKWALALKHLEEKLTPSALKNISKAHNSGEVIEQVYIDLLGLDDEPILHVVKSQIVYTEIAYADSIK